MKNGGMTPNIHRSSPPKIPIRSTLRYLQHVELTPMFELWSPSHVIINYWEHFSPFVFSFWFRVSFCSFRFRVCFVLQEDGGKHPYHALFSTLSELVFWCSKKKVVNSLTMLCPALCRSLSFCAPRLSFCPFRGSSRACLCCACIKSLGFCLRLPHLAWCVVSRPIQTHDLLRENPKFYHKQSFDYWKQDVHVFI